MPNAVRKYKSYEKYKNSGIEWLGNIPEDWEIKRLKFSTLSCTNGAWGDEQNNDENDIVCLRVADFNRTNYTINTSDLTLRNLSKEKINKLILQKNDLLIEKSGGGDNQPVGFVVQYALDFPAITSNFIAKIPPTKNVHSGFFKYLHSYYYSIRLNKRSIKQTTGIQNLDAEAYLNESAVYPLFNEQRLIAKFLDTKTEYINKIIDKKQRMIELLKEKRQAMIFQTVTQGLDKNVKLKPSGVDWVNNIPEQWMTLPAFVNLKEQQISNKGMIDNNLLSLSYGKIIRKDIDTTSGLLPESFETYQIVHKGNIILRLTDLQNDKNSLRVGLVEETGIITSAYLCLKSAENILPEYAYKLLYTYDILKVFYNMGGGVRQSLKYTELKWLPIILPPIEEQEKIILFLNSKIDKIDSIIRKIEQQIEKVKEYRQVLISNAVTGKIDVRDFVQKED
jgi:type I restriction enzyme S subunit